MITHRLSVLGEKLDNVEQRLDEMNVDLKRTDKNLRELESVCGCCYCPCGKPNVQVCVMAGIWQDLELWVGGY